MDLRIEMRKKDFKKTFDDPRRRREMQQVQIRKTKREAELRKKRQQALTDLESSSIAAAAGSQAAGATVIGGTTLQPPGVWEIPELAILAHSDDAEKQLIATHQFRRLLSLAQNPPLKEVVEANVVPRFVHFLTMHHRPDLQFEAAWALTNIASGDRFQTEAVVKSGAVPILVSLLSSDKSDVCEQAVWALGNIAGDCAYTRDLVLSSNVLVPLLAQLRHVMRKPNCESMRRNAAWTLSNLCRGKPRPSLEVIEPALPVLCELVHLDDSEILTDTCWAFSYLSDGNDKEASRANEAIIQTGVSPRLVVLLQHPLVSVYTPALRTVGNIVSGDEDQTEVMVASGCLRALRVLLENSNKTIRKEACWTISNIAAGNKSQIQQLIVEGLIPALLRMIKVDDPDVRKEISWTIANAGSEADPLQVEYLMAQDCISSLRDSLRQSDHRLIAVTLKALENILGVGDAIQEQKQLPHNPYAIAMEESNVLKVLEDFLSEHESDTENWKTAMSLVEKHFKLEEITDPRISSGTEEPGAPAEGFNFQRLRDLF